ncbi:MAG: flagellar assembly protein FliW [Phycisphaerales bacterium]|nr:flagellar assembly protein FliW [Phycisphaerales bacterium]
MLIETSRFGSIEVDDSRIMRFRDGMPGFPGEQRFALLQTNNDPAFFWLQSVDRPELAFVVCDPLTFVPDFQATIRREELESIDADAVEACQVFVIVNKVDGALTANLLGPLVIGVNSLLGRQLVLSEKKYSTRHRLMSARSTRPVARTA